MTLGLHFAVRSDVGLLRDGNEDAAYAGPRLLAVADGMGGHAAGEVASRLAIASVAPLDDEDVGPDALDSLRSALERAQEEIRARVATDPALDGMGTTLTALLWTGTGLGMAHIGDSRAYLFRDGVLARITSDHTYVQDLVDTDQITADEAQSHPQRSLLTRALDGRSAVDPDLSLREVRVGDRYLICSDGLSSVVRDLTLAEALMSSEVDAAADRLVELALRGGGPDNVTVVVCDVVETDELPARPVVVGAAADAAQPTRGGDTPAARAALALRRRRPRRRGSTPAPTRRRARRRLWVGLAGCLLALVVAVLGGWWWTRSQYFVGISDDRVTIFRGVAWSVAGYSLHSVSERRDVDPAKLPDFERDRLRAGIVAATLPQARRLADRLAQEQCAAVAPPTTRSPGMAAAPIPSTSAGTPPASATPLATPAPSGCGATK